jgi:hypothetical protein
MATPLDYMNDPDWEQGPTWREPGDGPPPKPAEDKDHSAVLRERLRDVRAILRPLPHETIFTTEQIAERAVADLEAERARTAALLDRCAVLELALLEAHKTAIPARRIKLSGPHPLVDMRAPPADRVIFLRGQEDPADDGPWVVQNGDWTRPEPRS